MTQEMEYLRGKTVVITGASKGIGAATARFLAAKGANVVACARRGDLVAALAQEITQAGGHAIGMACDVADYLQVKAVIDAAVARFGAVDILVNNAGLIDPIARLTDSDPAAWGHVVDVNVKGVYHGMHAALPVMQGAGDGVVINISSGAATGALEGWSHYCASKAAVLSLTRCGHKEYAEHGITVVGLSPGTVATDMQVEIKASGLNPVSQLDPSVHIPAQWVAQAIGFLCGPSGGIYAGGDFSLKSDEARAAVGLPLL